MAGETATGNAMIDEYDEVAKVVALFMEGAAAADAAKLEAAFHPQARLIGTGARWRGL